ncbi:hypothetical protein BHM03_00017182 [Ensete ventricosum]|nr:hypothetical protein BHM03_00017182 [Ensete ventricosum]
MDVTTNNSTEMLLSSKASYAYSLSHAGDELKSFRCCLRWMCIDESNVKYKMISWSLFLLLGVSSLPPLTLSSLVPPVVMPTMCSPAPLTFAYGVSYLCLFTFVHHYGFCHF